MKKYLFILIMSLVAGMATQAHPAWQAAPVGDGNTVSEESETSWSAPAEPILDESGADISSGELYYIKNVGAGQFLTGANSWSTQISLTSAGYKDAKNPPLVIQVVDTTIIMSGTSVSGYAMKVYGSQKVNGNAGERIISNTLLFRDSEESGFIDYNNQGRGCVWNITKRDGYYRIRTADGDAYYGDLAYQYAGWYDWNGPIEVDEDGNLVSGETTVNFACWVDAETGAVDDESAHVDWLFIPVARYQAQLEVYEARLALYELLLKAEELGVVTKEAGVVYTNVQATTAELTRATLALQEDVNKVQFLEYLSEATEDNPIDATEFVLVNPDFEQGDIEGWTTNYVSGQQANNIGYQSANYYNEKTEVGISHFIEAWKNNGQPWTIGDGYLQQTVYGLPAGKYVLEADAISVYQYTDHSEEGGIGKNPAEGVYLFIQAGNNEVRKSLATGNGAPEHFDIAYVSTEGDVLTFGLKTVNATANWIAADNFKIFYYGPTTDSQTNLDLKGLVAKANEMKGMTLDVKAILDAAVKNANDAISNDDETVKKAAISSLEAAIEKAALSIEAVNDFISVKYLPYYNAYSNLAKSGLFTDNTYPALISQIEGFRTASSFESEEQLSTLYVSVKDGWGTYIGSKTTFADATPEQPDTLTGAIINPKFSDLIGIQGKAKGWDVQWDGTGNVNESAYIAVNGTTTSGYELWNTGAFRFTQTLKGLPKGCYRLMMDGYYRCGTPAAAQERISTETSVVNVYLFAADATKAIHDWGLEGSENSLGLNNEYVLTLTDGREVYAPDRVVDAEVYLQNGYYIDNALDFYFDGAEEGFSFGVRKDNVIAYDWTYIDNFRLLYLGNGVEAYAEAIQSHIKEMEEVMENSILTIEGVARCEAAIAAADAALEGQNVTACIAAIEQINAASLYIQEGDILGKNVKTACESYVDRVPYVQTSDDWMSDYLAASVDSLYEGSYPSNAWLEAKARLVHYEWGAFIMQDAKGQASDLNPYDASAFFTSTNFVNHNGSGNLCNWALEISGSSWRWSTSSAGGFEAWGSQVLGLRQPTFYGLPEGFYRLTFNGFYRNGSNADLTAEMQRNGTERSRAMVYMNNGEQEDTILLAKYTDGARETILGVGDEVQVILNDADGNMGTYYLPNSLYTASSYFANGSYQQTHEMEINTGQLSVGVAQLGYSDGNWIVVSNFKLEFLGSIADRKNQLTAALTTLQDYLADGNAYDNALREEGIALAANANALLEAEAPDGAAMSLATKNINELVAKIKASMEAYQNLMATIESVQQRQSMVKDLSDEAKAEVEAALAAATAGYNAGSFTTEEVKAEIASLNQLANRLLTSYLVINLEEAGGLSDSISVYVTDFSLVENLKVTGPMNDTDATTLQSLTGLINVDLAGAQITNLNSAFQNHTALKVAVLPNTLTTISQYLFRGCSSLEDVTLPGTLTSIGSYLFSGITSLKRVTIGEGVTSLSYEMFQNCYHLSEVNLPSTLQTIGSYAFYNCYSYADIQLPENLTTINDDAFYRSSASGYIYNYQGYYYDDNGNYHEIYDTIPNLGPKQLVIPAKVTTIGYGAFYNMSTLESVTLNEGLTSLGSNAFYGTKITTATFPSTLTSVGSSVFNSGTHYTSLSLTPPTASNGCPVQQPDTLYVPMLAVKAYKQAAGWDKFKIVGTDILPDDITVKKQMTLDFADANVPEGYNPNITIWHTNVSVSSSSSPTTLGALEIRNAGQFTPGLVTHQGYNHAQANYYKYNWGSTFQQSVMPQSATLITDGTMHADNIDITLSLTDGYWNFISVPYDVRVGDITCETTEAQWVIRRYDGEARAAGNLNNTWVNMTADDILEAGKGYIMHSTYQQSMSRYIVFHFPALNNENKNLIFSASDRTIALGEYPSETANNRGWNLIGNPYPAYIEIGSTDFDAPITVWNGRSGYWAYSPYDDNYVLSPGEAFFVQRPANKTGITFSADARQSYYDVKGTSNYVKGIRQTNSERHVFNLFLSDGEHSDRTRVVINPAATLDYETERDAAKFPAMDATATQLYSVANGVQYAINERPLADGSIQLAAHFGQTGTFTFSLETKATESVILIDEATGLTTELNGTEGYTFTAQAGTSQNRFRLQIGAVETGIENLAADYFNDADVFTLDGKKMAGKPSITGVYLVKKNGTVRKVSVK